MSIMIEKYGQQLGLSNWIINLKCIKLYTSQISIFKIVSHNQRMKQLNLVNISEDIMKC